MPQTGFELLPYRLVDVGVDLLLVFGVADARDLRRYDRERRIAADRRHGAHHIVGCTIEGVDGHHVADGFDRSAVLPRQPDYPFELVQRGDQLLAAVRGHGNVDDTMHDYSLGG